MALLVCQTEAAVRINKVMVNLEGSEYRNEYVEILDTGPDVVDLDGWSIGNGASRDTLRGDGPSDLFPGEKALVTDRYYYDERRPNGDYTGVVFAEVEDRAIGNAGLSNGAPTTLYLRDRAGASSMKRRMWTLRRRGVWNVSTTTSDLATHRTGC